jgi:hypothetical protein
MKLLRLLAAGLALVVWLSGATLADIVEPDTDRPGGDYDSFSLKPVSGSIAGSPMAQCQLRCENDPRCKAWTLANPGVQGQDAVCWLKSSIPRARRQPCCTSGVPFRDMAAWEPNTDRQGADIAHGPKATAEECQAFCNGYGNCVAWTWVKPGVQGPDAQCYVKHDVPQGIRADCCISGVKIQALRVR